MLFCIAHGYKKAILKQPVLYKVFVWGRNHPPKLYAETCLSAYTHI